jgi:hypothetical protein
MIFVGPTVSTRRNLLLADGAMTPSALAVFMLVASVNFVARWTGRSAGLSPFRIRPRIHADGAPEIISGTQADEAASLDKR